MEHICRYIARPAVAEERLSINSSGEVVYRFKKPWSDGTTAIKLTPLELMERLAGLVPRPKVHLTRFHGVLAPHYKYRSEVVPQTKDPLQPDTASEQNKTTGSNYGGSNKDNPKVSKKKNILGQASQTSLQNRHGSLSHVPSSYEDHCSHRRSKDYCKNLNPFGTSNKSPLFSSCQRTKRPPAP